MHVVIKAPAKAGQREAGAADASDDAAHVRRLYEAWNERDWDALARALDPQVEWFHAGRHELVRGVDAVVAMMRSQAEAFPLARIDVRELRCAPRAIVAEWAVRHVRASSSTEAERPAIVCEVLELCGGRVVRASTYGDIVTLLMEFRDAFRPPLRAVC